MEFVHIYLMQYFIIKLQFYSFFLAFFCFFFKFSPPGSGPAYLMWICIRIQEGKWMRNWIHSPDLDPQHWFRPDKILIDDFPSWFFLFVVVNLLIRFSSVLDYWLWDVVAKWRLTGWVAGAALFGWSRSRFIGPAPAPTLTHRIVKFYF